MRLKNSLTFQRLLGFTLSIFLTLVAYWVIMNPHYFHFKVFGAMFVISILAVLQFVVQFIFFISIWREKGPPWNLGIFLSTLSLIVIIILGSIWIMHHLDHNMMPWMD